MSGVPFTYTCKKCEKKFTFPSYRKLQNIHYENATAEHMLPDDRVLETMVPVCPHCLTPLHSKKVVLKSHFPLEALK